MSFQLLFLIVVAGLFGPLLSGSRRLSIPLVVGEIIAGIVIGNSGLHWIDPSDPTLLFLSMVGFAMLLFMVGAKLPLRDPELRSAIRTGALATALSFAISVPVGFALAYLTRIPSPGLFLLLCACSSTSTVMPILLERKLGGRTVVLTTAWIVISDITAMVALPLVMATGGTFSIALGAVIITAVAVGCLIAMKFFRTSTKGDRLRELSKQRGWALDLRLSLAILFGLAWLATSFGTSVVVAGFAAGAVAALVGQPKRFYKQLIGIAEGLFVPLFFVHLGARINVADMFGSMQNLTLMLLIAISTVAVHLMVAKLVGLPRAAGLTASAQMGLPAAVVAIGLSAGFLNPGQGAAVIAAALLSVLGCSLGTAKLVGAPGTTIVADEKPVEPKPDNQSDSDD
jgi:Kef-type K+ transport system membrane component KefB